MWARYQLASIWMRVVAHNRPTRGLDNRYAILLRFVIVQKASRSWWSSLVTTMTLYLLVGCGGDDSEAPVLLLSVAETPTHTENQNAQALIEACRDEPAAALVLGEQHTG